MATTEDINLAIDILGVLALTNFWNPAGWLAGVTLDSSTVYEAWTSARGPTIMVLIQEVYGKPIKAGESFSTAYVVGYFDTIEEMHAVNERYKGNNALSVDASGWRLEKYRQPFRDGPGRSQR